ncbi:MAG: hypothetical protein O3A21_02245 [Proteobacteria bacterium]|nr:hypothetical protein [Pseudomonadota bacterium]
MIMPKSKIEYYQFLGFFGRLAGKQVIADRGLRPHVLTVPRFAATITAPTGLGRAAAPD